MDDASVKARAQADEALEQVAQVLKRLQGTARRALQETRQVQFVLKGITIETTESEGGHSHGSSDEIQDQAA